MKIGLANTGVHTLVSVTITSTMLVAGAPAQAAPPPVRLSLDPHAALLGDGATFFSSGYDAPLRLPAATEFGAPSFSLGFTIPDDYEPSTPLKVVILWEGRSTGCDYTLESNLLYRARDGAARDFGNATAGLQPVSASTAFTIAHEGFEIVMAAPATAHQTASAVFQITPTPGEFPTLQGGDAVNFGIFRPTQEGFDTCASLAGDELGIAGVSILYQPSKK